jgi:hypothetical protein
MKYIIFCLNIFTIHMVCLTDKIGICV